MSLMDKYSDIYGIDIKEVKEWVNGYVSKSNWPEQYPIEDDKEERIKSIKSYIQMMVDDSITGRIQGELVSERIASSQVKIVCECPF